MSTVNFFWRGKDFGFLENIVIHSHKKVGHSPVIWLSGEEPVNDYWNDILNIVKIEKANSIFNVDDFLLDQGNFRTAADLWRFNFLLKHGGLYCDTDAFALKKFPSDEWIVCSGEHDPSIMSIGVLKAPPNQKIFEDCIKNVKKDWGNVILFSDLYKKFFGHSNPTHENRLFYPYNYKNFDKLFKKTKIPSDTISIHFYGFMLSKNYGKKLTKFDRIWCEKNTKTLLGQLWCSLRDEA